MRTKKFVLYILAVVLTGCYSFVEARPWDEERQCWLPFEAAGIAGWAGDDAVTYAVDNDGRYWMFGSTNIPGSFEEITPQPQMAASGTCD